MKQLLVLLALLAASVSAQATAVTATLTYTDSQALAGATISADFVPSPTGGLPASAYLLSGSAFTQHVTATANSSGVFTMTLSDDRVIAPSGGRWQFTICTPTASPCFSSVQDVFGTTINLSTALSAAAPAPGGPATANNVYYADAEVAPAQRGSIYFNYVSSTFRCYDGSAWATCAGGSGTVTSISTTSPITGGPITGTGTLACATCGLTGSPLSQFAATTSSQLAGVVSDETGSGSLVFGTSPTLTTAVLGSSTATTQAANDNSTKVATTAYVDTKSAGAIVQLETHTASNSATLNFTTCLTNSSYHTFKVKIRNLVPATNSVQATLRMSTDGGATYDATSGIYDANSFVVNAGGTGNEVGLATTSMQIGWQSVGNTASNGGVSADFDIFDPANGANAKVNANGNQMYWSTSSTVSFWGGSYHSTAAVNAFQVLFSSGNITSGVVTCYGVTP